MGLKRIIAPNEFNLINGCYFDDFVTHGHMPIYLKTIYQKSVNADTKKTPVKISKDIQKTLSCAGEFWIGRMAETKERSPLLHLRYVSEELWDAAINKVCSTWGKDAVVREMLTKNRDNGHIVSWKRGATENGNQASQLVLDSVNDEPWTVCHYKTQRAAAGELWVDTCEYMDSIRTIQVPTCVTGSHAAA